MGGDFFAVSPGKDIRNEQNVAAIVQCAFSCTTDCEIHNLIEVLHLRAQFKEA
jgi:hypothetical protein